MQICVTQNGQSRSPKGGIVPFKGKSNGCSNPTARTKMNEVEVEWVETEAGVQASWKIEPGRKTYLPISKPSQEPTRSEKKGKAEKWRQPELPFVIRE